MLQMFEVSETHPPNGNMNTYARQYIQFCAHAFLIVLLCLLYTTQPNTHKSVQSPVQCSRCIILVLVCVELGDTATRVSTLRVLGLGVIGPNHKRGPRAIWPFRVGTMERPDSAVTVSFGSTLSDGNNWALHHSFTLNTQMKDFHMKTSVLLLFDTSDIR